MMKIAIRTDASGAIGAGHLMRTLSLADELRAQGATCLFICRECPPSLQSLLLSRGHQLQMLDASDAAFDERIDAEQTLAALGHARIDWIVVDHYHLSARWEAEIKTRVPKLMAIDDLANRRHVADLLLDQNLGRTQADYSKLLPRGSQTLLGSRHALLRPQFAAARATSLAARRDRKPRKLLITMGGMDHLNATCAVLDAMHGAALPAGSSVRVVLGADARWRTEVEAACARLPWPAAIAQGVTDMAALMAEADIAISAAGSTLWELCCVGVPTIAVITADNQRHSAAATEQAGASLVIDSVPLLPVRLPSLLGLMQAPSTLAQMQRAAAGVTDGLGCARVAAELKQRADDANAARATQLRAMDRADLDKVRAWRNHPEVRRWMHTTREIRADEHESWFEKSSRDPAQRLLIAEEDGVPTGFVRFSGIAGGAAEWGFYKVPDAPAGSGARLGRAALEHAFGALGLNRVNAAVLSGNQRSLHFHRKLGFRSLPAAGEEPIDHFTLGRDEWLDGERP